MKDIAYQQIFDFSSASISVKVFKPENYRYRFVKNLPLKQNNESSSQQKSPKQSDSLLCKRRMSSMNHGLNIVSIEKYIVNTEMPAKMQKL